MSAPAADITNDSIVSVRDLQVQFQTSDRRATVKAVDGVNFDVRRGETFGIIGESGSGKTTIGRALVFLLKPSAGAILHNGLDPLALPRRQFQSHRRGKAQAHSQPHARPNESHQVRTSGSAQGNEHNADDQSSFHALSEGNQEGRYQGNRGSNLSCNSLATTKTV